MSSLRATIPLPQSQPYKVAKAGLIGFAKRL